MSNLNNFVLLSGFVGADPDVKYNPNGTIVASMSLASSKLWKDREGNWSERTTWVELSCWGDLARKVEAFVKKGTGMIIKGEIATDKWEKDGKTHYKTYILMQEFKILADQPRSNESGDISRI